jgi:hypothetical protein
MAQLRSGLRAYALQGMSPREALKCLGQLLRQLATLLYVEPAAVDRLVRSERPRAALAARLWLSEGCGPQRFQAGEWSSRGIVDWPLPSS